MSIEEEYQNCTKTVSVQISLWVYFISCNSLIPSNCFIHMLYIGDTCFIYLYNAVFRRESQVSLLILLFLPSLQMQDIETEKLIAVQLQRLKMAALLLFYSRMHWNCIKSNLYKIWPNPASLIWMSKEFALDSRIAGLAPG